MKHIVPALLALALLTTIVTTDSTSKASGQYRNIQMVINQKTATVDGKAVELDPPATIINSKTVVPLRFLQENALQSCSTVSWDAKEKRITMQIPVDMIDCDTVYNLQKEVEKLRQDNAKLKEENDRLKKGEQSQESQVPPITYGPKNGIKFTLKSIVKDREGIRVDVIVENVSNEWCRFPASNTTMTLDGETYKATSWDPVFYDRINAGARQPGYIKFQPKSTTGTAKFTFNMWPQNSLKYFNFDIKVDLDSAIPASKN